MKFKKISAILLVSTLISSPAYAGVDQAVDNFFNSMNADVNGPTIVKNQSAGIISGGGFATRSQSVDLQLGYITPPSFNTSCGNVNFFTGSFSFMTNTDQLVKFLQNTLMTAGVTAVMTALKSATPNIAGTLQSMMDQANQLMGMFNNSCQLGTALGNVAGTYMGDAYAKTTGQSLQDSSDMAGGFINNTVGGSARSITNNMKAITDGYHNWVSKNASMNPTSDDANVQEMAKTYGSIIWKGIQSQSKFITPGTGETTSDLLSLADLVVSLTGDVVIYSPQNDGIGAKAKNIDPAIKDIKQFMTGKGGTMKVYQCPKFNALDPQECTASGSIPNGDLANFEYPLTGTYQGNMVKTIQQAVNDIQAHFENNKPLTDKDMFVISVSSTPIFAIAQTLDDVGMTDSINYVLSKYSEQIAYEILERLVSMSLNIAQRAVVARSNDATDFAVKTLLNNITTLQSQVNSYQQDYVKTDPVEMLQQLNYLKAYAQNQMSPAIMQKVTFARQLQNY